MKLSKFTRKILTITSGTILGIILVFGIFWVPFMKVILQPNAYYQAFQDQGLYQVFPRLISEYLSENSSNQILGDSFNQVTSKLDPEIVNQFILGLTPPEWFQVQIDTNLAFLFAFINGETDSVNFFIDLVPIRNNLESDESIKNLIMLLPPCTVTDLAQLLNTLGGEVSLPICRFPDQVMNIVFPLVQPYLLGLVSTIPDQIPLTAISSQQSDSDGWILGLIIFLRKSRDFSTLLAILAAIFIGLLILFSYPGLKRIMRNIGFPLITAGSTGLALIALIWIGFNTSGLTFFLGSFSAFPAVLMEVISRIFMQIMSNYLAVATMMGFVVLVSGVILYVLSRSKKTD